MRHLRIFFVSLLIFTSAYSQSKKEQEPYFYEIANQKLQEINERIKKNNGNTKGTGLKPFKRWESFWKPRVGYYGKFSSIQKNLNDAIGQRNSFYCSSSVNWSEVGPTSFPSGAHYQRGIGRLDFVKLHPDYNGIDNQTIYAGGKPGLWKSADNGSNWVNMNTDEIEIIACSDVAITEDHLGTEVLLLATGIKKGPDDPSRKSIGLKRSVNGGSTWTSVHLEAIPWTISDNINITEIAVDLVSSNRIYVSAIQFSWNAASDYFGTANVQDHHIGKLFVSEDYGVTWTKIYEGFAIEDIEFEVNDPNTIYFSGHKLVKAKRIGLNNYHFTDLTSKLSTYNFDDLHWGNGFAQRMEVEVTKSNPNVIYVFSQFFPNFQKILWKSKDAGSSFSIVNDNDFPSMTWLRGSLEVSHQDENLVYLTGSTESGRSTNGGMSWDMFSNTPEVHADTNDVEVSDTNEVFLANDAGVYRSVDNGISWQIASEGLGVSEIYDIGMSLRIHTSVPDIIEAGMLDTNCMVRTPQEVWENSDGTNGDGMICIVDPVNPNIVYSESQNGNVRRSTDGGLNFINYDVGGGAGLWVTPMVLDPNNHNRLLVGKNHIRVRESGSNSTEILIRDNSGVIYDVITSPEEQKISALNVAPSNSDVMYVAYETGIAENNITPWYHDPNRKMHQQIFKSENGGNSWIDISPADLMKGSHGTVSSIEIHPTNPDKIWVTYASYGINYQVIRSTDGGDTWENYSQGLEKVPANDIVITPARNNTSKKCDFLYLATDFGVYYRNSNMNQWECYSDGIPNVPVLDIEIDQFQNIIRCATFGRGVWQAGLHLEDRDYNNSLFTYETSCAADGNTTVTVNALDPTSEQWWGLFETTTPNQTDGNHTIQQIGDIQCCESGSATFTGLNSDKYYYVKHGVWDECHNWQETRVYIPSLSESTKSVFHFEDQTGQIKNSFCPDEDVYLNGISSEGETRYFVEVWEKRIVSTGSFSYLATYGPIDNQEVGRLNLAHEFLNNGMNVHFKRAHEYQIKLAVANHPCTDWIESTKSFTVCFIEEEEEEEEEEYIGFMRKSIFTITPNPSKGVFTIKSLNAINATLEVYSAKGQFIFKKVVKNSNSFQINLSKYLKGVYIVKVITKNHIETLKLIKE